MTFLLVMFIQNTAPYIFFTQKTNVYTILNKSNFFDITNPQLNSHKFTLVPHKFLIETKTVLLVKSRPLLNFDLGLFKIYCLKHSVDPRIELNGNQTEHFYLCGFRV